MKPFLLVLFFIFSTSLFAEPWLANRFSQNCAGCHAPGRLNLPPKGRRCTLSCQGCHVNPNGGGMRSQYGEWNAQRWLRSKRITSLQIGKAAPAPYKHQHYAKNRKAGTLSDKQKNQIPRLRTLNNVDLPPEHLYNKYEDTNWQTTAKDMDDFLSTVPADDPYRLTRSERATVGGELRYLYGQVSGTKGGQEITGDNKTLNFLMSADVGVRLRPIPEKLSFVIESRFYNYPANHELYQGFSTGSQVKSAYMLVDDLDYNTHFMAGLYRPMFGHYTPDHTTLSQKISGLNQLSVFRAIGIGTAPNVPYANIHYLQPVEDSSLRKDSGFVFNAGLRFVTFGLSGNFSYWKTENKTDDSARDMYSVTGGAMIGPVIINLETLRAQLTTLKSQSGPINAGNVYTIETKVKTWRENYLVFNFASSNVTSSLSAGRASQVMAGFKSFPIQNLELEALYVKKDDLPEVGGETKETIYQLQSHVYF